MYQFTLADLNRRSYYLIQSRDHNPRAHSGAQGPACLPPALLSFHTHLRRAVVLANVEACIVRCAQLAGQPLSTVAVNLKEPVGPDAHRGGSASGAGGAYGATPAERAARMAENLQALAPIEPLLTRPDRLYDKRAISEMFDEEVKAAEAALAQAGAAAAVGGCGEAELQELAYTFAAYQPAVLDERVKGSMSPCDPRSRTPRVEDVRGAVEGSVRDADSVAAERLTGLAVALLGAVAGRKPGYLLAGLLLQAACMCGHVELVDRLLGGGRGGGGASGGGGGGVPQLFELDIIRRLRAAWVGYKYYRPLQPWRSGRDAHQVDWLDFKCSTGRAVLIAHKVVETLILREDHGMTQSLLRPTGRSTSPGPGPATPLAAAAAGNGGGVLHVQADCSSSLPTAAAAALAGSDTDLVRTAMRNAALVRLQEGAGCGRASRVLANLPRVSSSLTRELLTDDEHAELEPRKWRLVTDLFRRPAACKPLALAMMHVVRAGKKDILAALREDRERRAAAAAEGHPVGADGEGEGELPVPKSEAGEEEEEEDAVAGEAARHAAAEEAAREAVKFRKLHRLAVQAAHLAVHSSSLSVVSDALLCVRSVHAWPALELAMLNDLAAHFPRQAAALLEAVPLQDVDLEDNVLPFGLPAGFTTVAVSDKDAAGFRQGGGSGSTQDAEHFGTQLEEDASIEASLLVCGRTWMALLFLFWPAEFASPTTRKLVRVLGCATAAFAVQGPGSCAVAVVFGSILLVLGLASRAVVAVVRILYWAVFRRIWAVVAQHFPGLRKLVYRIRDREAQPGAAGAAAYGVSRSTRVGSGPPAVSPATTPLAAGGRQERGHFAPGGGGGGGAWRIDGGSDSDSDSDDGDGGLQLARGLWHGFLAYGHNSVVDAAVGWGRGSASISCRKVPMPLSYGGGGVGGRQLDTALLEKLLQAPGLHPSVFGSRVLRALILFKWNYFTKYFIILQLLLHLTYMAVFTGYAFTIKDMLPVDGRERGPGAHTPGCQLQAPTRVQGGLLAALAVMTVDFLVQEIRQIRHFGLRFFRHTWDLLDVASVALVVASIALHLGCTSGVSPLTLRRLAAVQMVLLFMRLLYYAMASDKLGSFVRMVLETTYDLLMFFAFLSVVFVGFALAIIIAQGSMADEEQTFIKMFTMMYGDFDVDFLSTLDSGALGLDALTRVIASVYMILVRPGERAVPCYPPHGAAPHCSWPRRESAPS